MFESNPILISPYRSLHIALLATNCSMLASSMQVLTAAVYPCSYVTIYAQDAKLLIHFHKTGWISTVLLWTVTSESLTKIKLQAIFWCFNINQMNWTFMLKQLIYCKLQKINKKQVFKILIQYWDKNIATETASNTQPKQHTYEKNNEPVGIFSISFVM